MKNWKMETKAVQSGYVPGNGEARVLPLYQSTTFKYDDAQSVADLFDLKRAGFFYSRLANPTVDAFERKRSPWCFLHLCSSCLRCNQKQFPRQPRSLS